MSRNQWLETPELVSFAEQVRQMDDRKFSRIFKNVNNLYHDLALETFIFPGLEPLSRHMNAYSVALYKEKWRRDDEREVARAATRPQ